MIRKKNASEKGWWYWKKDTQYQWTGYNNTTQKLTEDNTKITEIKKETPGVTGLVTTTALNAKGTEIENKITDFNNLTTKTAMITKAEEAERKVPEITSLTTKAALSKSHKD